MPFTKQQLEFIESKFSSLTSREIFDHIKVNFGYRLAYTSFRTACYEKGLYKCEMRRWTTAEKKFLFDNYKKMGNIEIAQLLSKEGRVFSKKQIEKQIKLSKLKRSSEDTKFITGKNKAKGVYSVANYKRWEDKKHNEGDRVTWICNKAPRVMIKVNGSFIPYARYRYTQLHGPIEKGFKVFFKDCNPINVEDENLYLNKRILKKEDREAYRKNIAKYLFQEKFKPKPVLPIVEKKPPKQKENLITVIINEKIRLQVKPGTDIEKVREKYNASLNKNWEASNFQPMNLKINQL